MTWQRASILPVWVLTAIGAVLIGLLAPEVHRIDALPPLLAVAIVMTFVIQLAIQRKEGFVNRVMSSVGGALVVLAVATAVLLVLV